MSHRRAVNGPTGANAVEAAMKLAAMATASSREHHYFNGACRVSTAALAETAN